MRTWRILWHSNAPYTPTAYGGQTRLHTRRLIDQGHEIAISSFHGLQNAILNWHNIRIYPPGYDLWGNDVILSHARHWKADLIIPNMDAWVLQPPAFGSIPWVPRFPVDMEPLPRPVYEVVKHATHRIVETRFGERMLREAGLDSLYVPACVDTTVYTPGDRAEARAELGWPQDRFIVGMVAANKGTPSRKAFGPNIAAFAAFAQKHTDTLLYLHTTAGAHGEMDGENLPALIEDLGVQDKVQFADQYRMIIGFPDDHMVNVYRAMDVLLAVSLGEGFCVPVVEAQACGTPVIAAGWTATDELVFGGWKTRKRQPFYHTRFHARQYYPHEESVAGLLTVAYDYLSSETRRAEIAGLARTGALAYDADYVAQTYWTAALAAIEERADALPRGTVVVPQLIPPQDPRTLYDAIAARDAATPHDGAAERWYHDHRYEVARQLLNGNAKAFSRIIDLGCGDGALLLSLPGVRTGVDISSVRLKAAPVSRGKNSVQFVQGNALTFGEDAAYDVALCTEVIEHLHQPEALLANIWRILKPDGAALIGTLNDPEGRYVDGIEHVRAYDAPTLEGLATAAGFTVEGRASTVPGIYGEQGLLACPDKLGIVQETATGPWPYEEGTNLFVLLRKAVPQ